MGGIKTSFRKYYFLKPQIYKANYNQPYTVLMAKFICEIVALPLNYTRNLECFKTVHRNDYMDLLHFSIPNVPCNDKSFPCFAFSLQLKIKAIRCLACFHS